MSKPMDKYRDKLAEEQAGRWKVAKALNLPMGADSWESILAKVQSAKTLDQWTGWACDCQGKTLGEVFAREEECGADLLRKADAMRHEQELTALTVRLEVAEDQAEKLLAENRRLQSLVNENPQFEEMRRLKEENHRLTGALAEEQKQRGEIDRALGGGEGRRALRSLDEVLERVKELRFQERNEQANAIDLVALPSPADLPIGYAFKVANYVLDRAAELEE